MTDILIRIVKETKVVRFDHPDGETTIMLILEYTDERLVSWRVNPAHNHEDGYFSFNNSTPQVIARIGILLQEVALYLNKIITLMEAVKKPMTEDGPNIIRDTI